MDKIAFGMDEAPELIGIRPRLFAQLVARGDIKTFRIGRRRLVSVDVLRDYVSRQQQEADAERELALA